MKITYPYDAIRCRFRDRFGYRFRSRLGGGYKKWGTFDDSFYDRFGIIFGGRFEDKNEATK